MSALRWFLVIAIAALSLYTALLLWLIRAGRREEAIAVARFIPDCAVLFRRLLADEHTPRSTKLLLLALIGYLLIPLDLVPDFIPVAGQLDDAILVTLVLRRLLRATSSDLLREHWPGPPATLSALLRVAGQPGIAVQAANVAPATASTASSGRGSSASSMLRAIVSIVCAYPRMASRAPSSPQPAMYGIDSPPASRPTEPSTQ